MNSQHRSSPELTIGCLDCSIRRAQLRAGARHYRDVTAPLVGGRCAFHAPLAAHTPSDPEAA